MSTETPLGNGPSRCKAWNCLRNPRRPGWSGVRRPEMKAEMSGDGRSWRALWA